MKNFSLADVKLLDSYCANAYEKEVEYLVSFDTDRLLAGFRETAGLDTKGKTRYPCWENMLIGGHSVGHFVSACANVYITPNCSEENKSKLLTILTQMINGFEECQNAIGTGFLFGAQILDKNNIEAQFDNVEKGQTNIITQAWVPWYTMHKIIEGLLGVAVLNTSECAELSAKAKSILIKLVDWIYNRASKWNEQTHKTVLSIEYGGMNDCLYNVYQVIGYEKALKAAHFFDDTDLFKTISSAKIGNNILAGRHANTTIPKFIGSLNRFVVTGEKDYFEYAKNFWNLVTKAHTYANGGNSTWEHFGEDNNLYSKLSNCNCETCNSYNMLKLTKMLFMITGEKQYADWYEHTFINSILSSQNPETGMTTYFQPMASGYFKVYSSPFNHFWCCTGTGMENFSKLGESFYFADDDTLYINQYFSSVLNWNEKKVVVTQKSTLPQLTETSDLNYASFTFDGSFEGKIALRIPDWIRGNVTIFLNANPCNFESKNGYAIVCGKFDSSCELKIVLPMKIQAFNLPDKNDAWAFKYGPVILSAILGDEDKKTSINGVNVDIPTNIIIDKKFVPSMTDVVTVKGISAAEFIENINDYLVRDDAQNEKGIVQFKLNQTDSNLLYIPHYLQCQQRYGLYFRFLDEKTSDQNKEDKLSQSYINANKIDTVQPGYGQYENDDLHKMTEYGNGSAGQTYHGTSRWAKAGGSFSYRMIVDPAGCELLVSFDPGDEGKSIQIKAGNKVIFEGKIEIKNKKEFNSVVLPLKKDVLSGTVEKVTVDGKVRDVVTITFSGVGGEQSAQICEFLYTLRK